MDRMKDVGKPGVKLSEDGRGAQKTGLDEFKAVFSDFRTVAGYVTKGTAAFPLVDYLVKFGSPWPAPSLTPVLTSLIGLLGFMALYHFCYDLEWEQLGRCFTVFLVMFFCCLFAYSVVWQRFTQVPDAPNAQRVVKGFTLTPNALELAKPPLNMSPYEIWQGWSFDTDRVWTGASILIIDVSLLSLWIGLYVSLVASVGSFILYERRRRAEVASAVGYARMSQKDRARR